jgi:transcriptional regulator with XRE-family HTH domain
MILGEKIRYLVRQRGMTVEEFAAKMEMSQANVYKMYKKDSIDSQHLVRLSKLFGVEINYFLSDQDIESVEPLSINPSTEAIAKQTNSIFSKVEKHFVDRIEELKATIDSLKKDKEFLQDLVKAKYLDPNSGKLEASPYASIVALLKREGIMTGRPVAA